MKVDPKKLLRVEHAGRFPDGFKGELFDQLFAGEKFLIAVRPAEPDKVIQYGFRKVTHVAINGDGSGAVPFAEPGFVQTKYQWYMGELRWCIAECLI